MKKTPNKHTLNYVLDNETNYLGEDRKFYQSRLEADYPNYDFSLLSDIQLMNIYESFEHEQPDLLEEYFD